MFYLNATAKREIYICLNKFETGLVHNRCLVSETLRTVLYHCLTGDVHVVWTLSSVKLIVLLLLICEHYHFSASQFLNETVSTSLMQLLILICLDKTIP